MMNHTDMLSKLEGFGYETDIVVIGGGATGLGVAVDAATRGYSVVLLEKVDFAKGTSCKSTKLVHGGVRYLQHGDVLLVLEALRERGRMKQNAPHLVKDQAFVISNYTWWDNFLYFCGLTFYDILSFGFGFGRSRFISPRKVLQYLPTVIKKGLKGGIVYHDGQFDDSRMAINLAQTAAENGAVVLNRASVEAILHDTDGNVSGVRFTDFESERKFEIKSKCVINASGVFVDEVMSMDMPAHKRLVTPSQGIHLVFDRKFLPGDHAMMIPKTSDGRVLFAVPWHNRIVVGTTDIPQTKPELEPKPLKEEVDFILETAALYFETPPTYSDVLCVFAGQRPLAAPDKEGKSTREISRGHKIIVSPHRLITITGGKWTSYRLMAEDTVDRAIRMGLLENRPCVTKKMRIHGYRKNPDLSDHLYVYGSDRERILDLIECNPALGCRISERYPYTAAEVVWAVREEMALDVEDVLARRVRLLYIDAAEAIKAAPQTARIIADELGRDQQWVDDQVAAFTELARKYTLEY